MGRTRKLPYNNYVRVLIRDVLGVGVYVCDETDAYDRPSLLSPRDEQDDPQWP